MTVFWRDGEVGADEILLSECVAISSQVKDTFKVVLNFKRLLLASPEDLPCVPRGGI